MKMQFIRTQTGRVRGLAILLGNGAIQSAHELPEEGRETYRRICDGCTKEEAVVFCTRHNVYSCEDCLEEHSGPGCQYYSMAVVRDIVGQWKRAS